MMDKQNAKKKKATPTKKTKKNGTAKRKGAKISPDPPPASNTPVETTLASAAKEIEEELNQKILRGETPSDDDFRKFFIAIGFEDGIIPTPTESPEDYNARAPLKQITPEEPIPQKIPAVEGKRCPKGRIRKGKWCVLKKPPAKPNPPTTTLVLPTTDVVEAEQTKRPAKTAMNRFLDEKESIERLYPLENHEYLYPDLNDPNFNIKIALKREFQDAQYDGQIRDIEKQADILCKAKFELSPHQVFVKNFLSVQTPYKGLLLYHGLGTGKTCSAIGVAEEMRRYMKRTGLKQQIIVVASPNVQGNFRQQLFDERKLTKVTNVANVNEYTWNIESCVGNSLINEINPNSIRNLSREKLISNINSLINEHYSFVGYIQFANIARSQMGADDAKTLNPDNLEREIRRFFNNRLIIIDEVHNIRLADDSNKKEMQQVASVLMTIVKHAKGLRLLLLSATPMFNSYKEIIWVANLLNANDGRSQIQVGDVFEADGSFRKSASKAEESGEELLRRKLTGYVSYVRGENPYTFPYRLYPTTFSPERALSAATYPKMQMNGVTIDSPMQNINVYVNRASASSYQMRAYQAIVDYMRRKSYGFYTNAGIYREMPSFENMESFGYTLLQRPLEALNIIYPDKDLSQALSINDVDARAQQYTEELFQNATGGKGLSRVVSFDEMENGEPLKHNYEYKTAVRVFSQEELPNYSVKMAEITAAVKSSEGIVLIYSQYIDGGVVPMALALEEMGFTRHCHGMGGRHKHLFKRANGPQIDAITMKPREEGAAFQPAQYIMITGDKGLSPSNTEDVKYATNADNMDGSKVKVIIISKAGSEGLDFKAIRQVHILEPWFNMNRIEQIIGRGVRNLSHCALPFAKRNVQIYLHATIIYGVEEEPADLYLYRLAERKAMQIGKVTRVLKETAADCILHIGQTNFTVEKLSSLAANQNVRLELSSKRAEDNSIVEIEYKIGDLDGSELCDYMSCEYQCKPRPATGQVGDHEMSSYTESNVESNMYYIIGRIKELYRERHAYTLDQIRAAVNAVRIYPVAQIYYVLSRFVDNRNMSLFDKYGRFGYLLNRGKFYEFQPVEITDERASIYERSVPVEYKRSNIVLELPAGFKDAAVAPTRIANEAPTRVSASAKSIEKTRTGEQVLDSYSRIIRDIRDKTAMVETEQTISSTEMNWYKNASHALKHMEIVYGFPKTEFTKYVVFHYIDSANYLTKRTLFEFTFGKRGSDFTINLELETYVAEYFRDSIMTSDDRQTAVFIADKEQAKLLILSRDSQIWTEGDKYDAEDFADEIADKYKVNKARLNNIVGYMLQFKNQEMSFYYKDIHLSRNKKGRKCDRSGGKAPIIKMLNSVTGTTRYNDANTSSAYMYSGTLCVILEMALRSLHLTQNGRVFYLTPEQAIHSKITEYSVA